ncbi:MAG: 4-hydroxy-tetrahydrodipicolinate synthase [Clostridium sp.]
MSIFTGSGVAIVTPFKDCGIDFDKLEDLINWHIEEGTDAIVVCGTTGEASTMTDTEKKEAIKFTIDTVNKRIPVIAGTGSNNTASSIEMSKWADSIGVDGLLVITPYYNKTTQEGCIKHFEAIATAVNTPIIVYNVPSRTGLNLCPCTLQKIAKLPNIIAIKEASGNIGQVAQIAHLCPELDIYSGNDDQIIPIMSLGGRGVISVVANILPKDTHNICEKYLSGDIKGALALQLEMLPLINSLFIECNPIPIKAALNIIGKNVGTLRLPLVEMTDGGKELLADAIKDYGINS